MSSKIKLAYTLILALGMQRQAVLCGRQTLSTEDIQDDTHRNPILKSKNKCM